jgi:hypothetical protein
MKHLTLHLCKFMQKSPYNSAKPTGTYVIAKAIKFFGFATEITEHFFIANASHRFIASLHEYFFLYKALRQRSQIGKR